MRMPGVTLQTVETCPDPQPKDVYRLAKDRPLLQVGTLYHTALEATEARV